MKYELTVDGEIIFKGIGIVIPTGQRKIIKQKINPQLQVGDSVFVEPFKRNEKWKKVTVRVRCSNRIDINGRTYVCNRICLQKINNLRQDSEISNEMDDESDYEVEIQLPSFPAIEETARRNY